MRLFVQTNGKRTFMQNGVRWYSPKYLKNFLRLFLGKNEGDCSFFGVDEHGVIFSKLLAIIVQSF
jgi:hypothetical protein